MASKISVDGKLYSLWYENESGEKFVPDMSSLDRVTYPGFIYQHSEFPASTRHTVLRMVVRSEVDACAHPVESIRPTGGWIDGVEGRKCTLCNGTQTKSVAEPWPLDWDSHGSIKVFSGDRSWPTPLALAIARPSLVERLRSLWRGYIPKRYRLDDAIMIASRGCEACMNALAHRYGLTWGYREDSKEHRDSGTSCLFCKQPGVEPKPRLPRPEPVHEAEVIQIRAASGNDAA